MFYEEIRTKQDLSYNISICSLRILYDSKFILMTMSLGTNTVVVTRDYCIRSITIASICIRHTLFALNIRISKLLSIRVQNFEQV